MLGTGVCGSRPRNGEIKWNQVVGQGSGPCIFPKESLKWDGNQMKSGTGEGVLTFVKKEKKYKYQLSNNFLFGRKFTLTSTRDLGLYTLPETNIAPESLGLEDEFPCGKAYFQVLC